MPKNNAARFVMYGISCGALTGLCYAGLKLVYQTVNNQRTQDDVNEVHFLNELSDTCGPTHLQRRDHISSPQPICKNPYCALQKINRIVHMLDNAKYSIDICIYTFTSHMLAESIKNSLKRGVIVRIISDREMVFSSGSQMKNFVKYLIPVRGPNTSSMMHNKFCIVDGPTRVLQIMQQKNLTKPQPHRSTVLSGSVNWTSMGFGGNWENFFITSNRSVVDTYQIEFNRMWQKLELV